MAQTARKDPPQPVKPYHHGDLQRALIDAAERILEREGAAALSLRAVAREAGVSPAAPYHHFKDKDELVNAVAKRGFEMLTESMRKASDAVETPRAKTTAQGVAYVCFARDHPAMYHVMFDGSRKRDPRTSGGRNESTAYRMAREIREKQAIAEGADSLDVELATIAGWCAAHGLAELCFVKEFDDMKKQLGGDEPFFRAVLEHLGSLSGK